MTGSIRSSANQSICTMSMDSAAAAITARSRREKEPRETVSST
jgi:hypothetical protein